MEEQTPRPRGKLPRGLGAVALLSGQEVSLRRPPLWLEPKWFRGQQPKAHTARFQLEPAAPCSRSFVGLRVEVRREHHRGPQNAQLQFLTEEEDARLAKCQGISFLVP